MNTRSEVRYRTWSMGLEPRTPLASIETAMRVYAGQINAEFLGVKVGEDGGTSAWFRQRVIVDA